MSQLAQEAITFWKADCETTNFEFEAYGATEAEARTMLEKGFRKHARQCGLDNDWYCDYADCIRVNEIRLAACYRDREPLTTLETA